MFCRFFIVCCVVAAVASIKFNKDRLEEFKKRLDEIKTDEMENRSERLKEIISNIPMKGIRNDGDVDEGNFMCNVCDSILGDFLIMRRVQMKSDKYLKDLAVALCVELEIQSEEVCYGVVEVNAPSIFYIVDNRPDLSEENVCRFLLSAENCGSSSDAQDFTVVIDNGTSSKVQKTSDSQKKSSEDLSIIHITDIHVDLMYSKNAFADCDEWACCRDTEDTIDLEPESCAGYWGDYRSCDSPWLAIDDSFHQIRKQHSKIDIVYFTGDTVDHFMWNSSVDGTKIEIEKVHNLMSLVFDNVSMYPILGNHDAQNIFTPKDVHDTSLSIQWLYDHVAELWSEFLPQNAIETVRTGGYYTTLIRPGLRLIALNNNVCLTFNWWIMFEVKSIQSQFQWLHDVLLASENAGEKVHIIAHVPNGDDNFHLPCSREYRKIVDRFHETIAAQFHGHTEFFGFNIFYKNNSETSPISVSWDGGSLATFSGVNRNYMSYSVDPVSFQVKDIESWIYNLTAANQNAIENPSWFRQFSLRDAFLLKDLTPSTINGFVRDLPQNATAVQQLWEMKIKNSDLLLRKGCGKKCVQNMLCGIITTDNNDKEKCQKIMKQVEGHWD